MPIHKLAEGPITITVTATETVQGNYGEQVKLSSTDGIDVYISSLTAAKQLARLNLDLDTVVGQTLHLEQIKKNGTTYTNISKATAGAAAPAPRAAAAPAAVSAAPKMTVSEAAVIYGECVAQAMVTLGARCEDAGIPIDASAIQAAAATLFIKVTR
jgi:hypothetical protein